MSKGNVDEPEAGSEPVEAAGSRRLLLAKAGGLLIVWVIVGAALLMVMWLLVAITISLIGSL